MVPTLYQLAQFRRYLSSEPLGVYLARTARVFALAAGIPFVIGLIGAWSDSFGFVLFILVGIPTAAFMVLLTGFKLWRGVSVAQEGRSFAEQFAAIALSPILLVLWLMAVLPLLWAGGHLGSLSRLAVNESDYREIINRARVSRKAESYAEYGGVTYSVDPGPPVRVAFNPEGFLDNWSAIVFDPTGEVMLADGFDPTTGKFYAPERITKLFDGDLVACRKLWGDYYSCSFT